MLTLHKSCDPSAIKWSTFDSGIPICVMRYTVLAYPPSGHTRVKYAVSLIAVAQMFRFRLGKPIVAFCDYMLSVTYIRVTRNSNKIPILNSNNTVVYLTQVNEGNSISFIYTIGFYRCFGVISLLFT